MLQYSKVFKFLIMTGRMSWVLQEDFNIMKMERNAVISEQYHKVRSLIVARYGANNMLLFLSIRVRLPAAAVVQAFHDPIHERSSQLFDVQRATRKLERVREGSAKLSDDRSDLSLAYELHQEDTFEVRSSETSFRFRSRTPCPIHARS